MTHPTPPAGPGAGTHLGLLLTADQHLVRTVDGLSAEDLAQPSTLPGWSRGHVVAHLALNAEGLEGVLAGAARGEPRPMYASPESRDADIEELAAAGPAELRERLLTATHCFTAAVTSLTDEHWRTRFDRTPGGPSFPVATVPLMRLREVEIHHADLGTGYTAADWPAEFAAMVIESMTKRPYPRPFRVLARDLAQTWELGEGEPGANVTGDAAALAWWLTGRGDGAGLTVDEQRLPEVPPW